jgi:hypothetical protein
MQLKEFKNIIDTMFSKYGDIDIMIDLATNNDVDDTIYKDIETGNIYTEQVLDISEVKDNTGDNVEGICISNYKMKNNNWGRE